MKILVPDTQVDVYMAVNSDSIIQRYHEGIGHHEKQHVKFIIEKKIESQN